MMAESASVGEVVLSYTDKGAGEPPILLVHGSACDSGDWAWQLDHFAESHRVLAVDLRGHGRSSAPPSGYDAPQLAADLATLLDQLACPPVIGIGHSLGGLVLTTMAANHPDTTTALVCIDPAYLTPDQTGQTFATMSQALERDPRGLMADIFADIDKPSTPNHVKELHQRRIKDVPEHVIRQVLDDNTRLATRSMSEPIVSRRTCPVLSLHTRADRAEAEAPLLHDPRSRTLAWPECGHWPHQERPSEFNTLVDEWLMTLR